MPGRVVWSAGKLLRSSPGALSSGRVESPRTPRPPRPARKNKKVVRKLSLCESCLKRLLRPWWSFLRLHARIAVSRAPWVGAGPSPPSPSACWGCACHEQPVAARGGEPLRCRGRGRRARRRLALRHGRHGAGAAALAGGAGQAARREPPVQGAGGAVQRAPVGRHPGVVRAARRGHHAERQHAQRRGHDGRCSGHLLHPRRDCGAELCAPGAGVLHGVRGGDAGGPRAVWSLPDAATATDAPPLATHSACLSPLAHSRPAAFWAAL